MKTSECDWVTHFYLKIQENFMRQIFLDSNDWFDLISLFNGISTFVGYLMPKLLS